MNETPTTRHEVLRSSPTVNWWTTRSPKHRWLYGRNYLLAKRAFDLFFTLGSVPIWLPILGLCALLIKLTSPTGPIFFVQERTGQGGIRFGIYKFRTMVANAEQLKRDLMHLNELSWPDFKITRDPRITPLGRILRKTSLDELPQLLNVLQGKMSLVGPRPTSFSAETYALWQTERLDVQPGITGLWQLYGRGTTEFDARLRLDIAYIERRCLWLDFSILVRTIISVIQHRGAF